MILVILAALLALVPAARANDFMAASTANGLLAYTFPLSTVTEGAFDVQLAPAYFTTKFHDSDDYPVNGKTGVQAQGPRGGKTSGFGGAAGVSYGVTDHLAVGATYLQFQSNSGSFHYGLADGSMSEKGYIAAATVVFDPMSGENFRLPLLFGFNYQSLTTTYDPIDTEKTLRSPGVQFGISAQFNTGKYLRWEPFLLSAPNFGKVHVSGLNGTLGAYSGGASDYKADVGAVPGLNVIFRPWNLAAFIAPSVGPQSGSNIYALRWSKRLGGGSTAGPGVTR